MTMTHIQYMHSQKHKNSGFIYVLQLNHELLLFLQLNMLLRYLDDRIIETELFIIRGADSVVINIVNIGLPMFKSGKFNRR